MAVTGAIAAVAGAVGSVGVGAYNASTQSGIAGQARNQSATVFNEQQGYASMLQNLIANPGSVTSLPGYNFQESQGEQAVARQFGPTVGSGAEGEALTQYGQNFAQSAYGQQVQVLSSLSGLSSSVNPTSSLAAASGASSASNNSLQQLLATLGFLGGSNGGFGGLSGLFGGSSPAAPNSGNFDGSLTGVGTSWSTPAAGWS